MTSVAISGFPTRYCVACNLISLRLISAPWSSRETARKPEGPSVGVIAASTSDHAGWEITRLAVTLGPRRGTRSSKRARVDSKSDRLANVTTTRSICLPAPRVMPAPLPSAPGQEGSLVWSNHLGGQKTSRSGLGHGLHGAEPTFGQTAHEIVRLFDEVVDAH